MRYCTGVDVNIERSGNVVRLTLRAPPMNALDLDAITSLGDYFRSYPNDVPLVITGDGRAFSAGVDTKAFAGYSHAKRQELFAQINRMTAALLAIRVPVVAAINGHALGGGFVLALCADYRVAAEGEHKFGLTEAKAGVPFPEGPVEIIKAELPAPLIRHLTLSSSMISTQQLLAHLVFDEVLVPNALQERARTVAASMAQQPAFQKVKQQVKGGLAAKVAELSR